MHKIIGTALLWALGAFGPILAHGQVQASLVTADSSVSPGQQVTVAVRLEHEPHWHTYWIYAGTGIPTSVQWNLPSGWTAGPIQWPTPITIKNPEGEVTGNGYEGVAYLPITLTSPANAPIGRTALKANVKWLMCSDVCIPGSSEVSLDLSVALGASTPNLAVRESLAKMPMPEERRLEWHVVTKRHGKFVTLQIDGASAVNSPHFFSETDFIQYDQPQRLLREGQAVSLDLAVADDAEPDVGALVGVLAYTDDKGAYRGVRVNAPLGDGTPATSAGNAGSPNERAPPGGGTNQNAGILSGSFALTLTLAALGGLILNLMPCVFPVLAIKVLGFVNLAGGERRKISLHGVVFTAGVLISFWSLAALLAVLRASGAQLGWGFQLQSASFVFALSATMLIFALNLSGVFEFGLKAMGIGASWQMQQGYFGTFFTGVLATVVATPCSAPFLAPALGAALALPTAQSLIVFTAIALGLSAPYLLLSIYPGAIGLLPRPGRWMETLKQLLAFPLYATAGFLIWVLAGQVSESGLLMAILGLTVIGLAVWWYGRSRPLEASTTYTRVGMIGSVLLLAGGLNLGWPHPAAATDIAWEAWSAQRIEQLRAEGRPIYVDFTARWCATCQANKKVVFASADVKRYFKLQNVATLKADWTNSDSRITAELARWNRSAVPFNLVYLPSEPEPKVLPEVLTPGVVLRALQSSKHVL